MPKLYEDLRRLATARMGRENPGQTISGTALVHEAYLRLNKESDEPRWANRKQFFSAAAEAMRRILIDRVRAKQRVKRGGEFVRSDFDEAEIAVPTSDEKLLQINDALDELAAEDPASADLVKLRFFAGFTLQEIAESQDVSVRSVTRNWSFARAWLARRLELDN